MYTPSHVMQLSADELDLIIGDSLLEGEFGSKPVSEAEKRSVAANWFRANLDRFHVAICTSAFVNNYLLGKNNKTRNEILAAVVDALLKLGGWGTIPVVVLGARLMNYGLDQLCPQVNAIDQQTRPAT